MFYLGRTEPSVAMPDPSLYFNGWGWAVEDGILESYQTDRLPGEETQAILHEVRCCVVAPVRIKRVAGLWVYIVLS